MFRTFAAVTAALVVSCLSTDAVAAFGDPDTTFGTSNATTLIDVSADDSDRIIEPNDFLHAPDCLGFGVIDAPHPAAKHGRSGECGDLHARQRHVDAVYGGAVHLLRRVQTLCGRADELDVCRRFERDVFGYRQLCGIRRESAVTGPAAACSVDYFTLLGPT